MAGKNYYKILGIGRDASEKQVKQAYRRLARKYHPDVNPDNDATESKFKEINEAYEVLSDPGKRKRYDQFGDNWQYAQKFTHAGARGPFRGYERGGAPFNFDDLGNEGLGDIFGDIFQGFGTRGATGTKTRPKRKSVTDHPIDISLQEAFSGTTRVIEVNGQRLEVRIPSGVNNGSKIRVAPGATQAGEEIHLVISVKPDKDFERKGDDLHVEVPVPLVDAVLGGEVEVMSLKGKLALTIPPETQNGKAFRLANQGMPHMNGTGKGDLVARIRVVLPTNLTEEQRELFRELRSLSQ